MNRELTVNHTRITRITRGRLAPLARSKSPRARRSAAAVLVSDGAVLRSPPWARNCRTSRLWHLIQPRTAAEAVRRIDRLHSAVSLCGPGDPRSTPRRPGSSPAPGQATIGSRASRVLSTVEACWPRPTARLQRRLTLWRRRALSSSHTKKRRVRVRGARGARTAHTRAH